MRRARLLAVLAIAAVLLVACRPGDLDPTFGSGGLVKLKWPGSFEADIGDLIQEPSTGKLVTASTLPLVFSSSMQTMRCSSGVSPEPAVRLSSFQVRLVSRRGRSWM